MAEEIPAPAPHVQLLLTHTFRQQQEKIDDAIVQSVIKLWQAGFSPIKAIESFNIFRPAVIAMILKYFLASQVHGEAYYRAQRVAHGLKATPKFVHDYAAKPLDKNQLDRTVDSCGPGTFLHEIKQGATPDEASKSAKTKLASASGRLVLSGGRDYVAKASAADPMSHGTRMVLEDNPCNFCQSLADQGVIPGEHGWHDNCHCTSEPVFQGAR